MSDPTLSDDDIQTLIAYARRKYGEERWPLDPGLRPVREALAKLAPPKSESTPLPAPKPFVPSLAAQRRQKQR